jgi:hypothetical protein
MSHNNPTIDNLYASLTPANLAEMEQERELERQRNRLEMELERAHERSEKCKELAQALSAFVNSAGADDIKELASEMTRDHRTLVQSKMGLFLQFAKVLDAQYQEGHYDARNEHACKLAGQILELTGGATRLAFI